MPKKTCEVRRKALGLLSSLRRQFAECTLPKSFRVEQVCFVQNTRRKEWLDLGENALGHAESRLVGELVDLLAG
jgi:hypothetical protein